MEETTLLQVSTELAKIITKQTTSAIQDKLKISRQKKDDKDLIKIQDEIIQDLLNEKNELIRIALVYDEQLVAQKISHEDIEFITSSITPLLEKITGGEPEDMEQMEALKPLLSIESFKILQLLGFNFKEAIGTPLTKLTSNLIQQKVTSDKESFALNQLNLELQNNLIKLAFDAQAFNRYNALIK